MIKATFIEISLFPGIAVLLPVALINHLVYMYVYLIQVKGILWFGHLRLFKPLDKEESLRKVY